MESTSHSKTLELAFTSLFSTPTSFQLNTLKSSDFGHRVQESNHEIPQPLNNGSNFCLKCNTLLVPGLSLIMRIRSCSSPQMKISKDHDTQRLQSVISKMNLKYPEYLRTQEATPNRRRRKKVLVYKCLACGKTKNIQTYYNYSEIGDREGNQEILKIAVASQQKKTLTPRTKKPKKKKKSNLFTLLDSKKRQEENESRKGNIFSLNEFLKQ